MIKKSGKRIYTNRMFWRVIVIYMLLVICISCFASYATFKNSQGQLNNRLDMVMSNMNHIYSDYTEDFWRFYMPIVSNEDGAMDVLKRFLAKESGTELTPFEKTELTAVLNKILLQDDEIEWVGLYSGKEALNYIYFSDASSVEPMPADFGFIEDMEKKGTMMEVFGSRYVEHKGQKKLCFALCGGTIFSMQGGKLIVGYAVNEIDAACINADEIEEVSYYITNDLGVIYDSTGNYRYPEAINRLEKTENSKVVRGEAGEMVFIRKLEDVKGSHQIFCVAPWRNIFLKHTENIWKLVGIVMICFAGTLVLYVWMRRGILHKIEKIDKGLKRIGDNDLDYRIPVWDGVRKDEFEIISDSINQVAARLQENINKTYELKLRQKEAMLNELQAKFDPHFLYNVLEVIRGKVYENGDIETSDVIIKLSQIFRSFVGTELFFTIQEEINACSTYISLLKYRYEDHVKVVYDMDGEIMQYGIVRSLLQPVLENFFVHGFNPENIENRLEIRGKIYDDKYIVFWVRDNGLGISEERLRKVQESLNRATKESGEGSYGLKNVHRRIQLFYGPDCGIRVERNNYGGVTVEVKICRMSLEEHKARLYEPT